MSKTTCPVCGGLGKSYKERCNKCSGTGHIRTKKTITVSVPSGIDTGNRLRVSGKGDAGENGGPNGDLYIEFVVEDHKFYQRDENDIYLELPISITDAILGCKKEIPTIHGNVTLTIPSGSDSGDRHRLRGKGIDNKTTRRIGDMYVILKVKTPKKLSKEQKRLLEELSKTDVIDSEIKAFDKFVNSNK